jgi:chromosome segregation ATPase
MNEAVVEKLVQKVINLIGEVNDVNIVVRGIAPPQEVVNKIHERIDVLVAGMQQIEKKLDLDEGRLKELKDQTKSLKEEMEFRKSAVHDVEERIIKNNESLGQSFYSRLETMDDHARRRFEEMGKTFQSTFWTQKWWLIVLSVVLFIFAIVVIHR